jgi:maltose alpha-D-glucosyltransferase / alpha-amylase
MKKNVLFIVSALVLVAIVFFIFRHQRKEVTEEKINKEQVVSPDSTDELWYKKSIIYTLDVEVFKDSDHDGIGDFKGLISRLGYIDSLGADAIWLSPFQPTPNKDDGYDVSDYYQVDKRLGTLEDFAAFMQRAKALKLKVIMDLVINHTSDQHPWFKEARSNKNSPYRPWYVWSKELPENYNVGMVFPGVQKTIWSYDSVANEFYYHRFYSFQPDLNAQYEPVQKEIKKIIKFWMDRGINGFRLDGVPFFIEIPQKTGEKFEHQYEMLTDMRHYVNSLDKDAIILGEANVLPDENKDFFGEHGDGMHMMFNFFVNQHLFYALATGKTDPLINALERTKEIPKNAEWGQFLRNHDEVDLGRLSEKEREEVYKKFGPEKNMQLYERGIRRRLAPMMNNNKKQLQLAYSALFSLPSTPVMRYGDEIGMGDDLRLQERLSVRTPMQWNNTKNAGFTNNDKPVQPVINTGVFKYADINVSDEQADSSSLLNWTVKMVKLRKKCPEISFGQWDILDTGSEGILAIHYQWNDQHVITLHNFTEQKQEVTIRDKSLDNKTLHDMITAEDIQRSDDHQTISLERYGYKWFRVR